MPPWCLFWYKSPWSNFNPSFFLKIWPPSSNWLSVPHLSCHLLVSFAAGDANELLNATSVPQGLGVLHVLGDDLMQCAADSCDRVIWHGLSHQAVCVASPSSSTIAAAVVVAASRQTVYQVPHGVFTCHGGKKWRGGRIEIVQSKGGKKDYLNFALLTTSSSNHLCALHSAFLSHLIIRSIWERKPPVVKKQPGWVSGRQRWCWLDLVIKLRLAIFAKNFGCHDGTYSPILFIVMSTNEATIKSASFFFIDIIFRYID